MSITHLHCLAGTLVLLALGMSACSSRPPEPAPAPSPSLASPAAAGTPSLILGSDPLSLLRSGRAAEGRLRARQDVEARPDSSDAHRLRSEVEFMAGDYDAALLEANEAARLARTEAEERMANFTLLRIQMFTDPPKALASARKQAGPTPEVADAVLLADAILLDAAVKGLRDGRARQASKEARALLETVQKKIPRSDMAGDYYAVLGNSYLIEGDRTRAEAAYRDCLKHDLGMADRTTDVENALAWIAFQKGDVKATGEALDKALASLATGVASDGFGFLPKGESYSLMRLAFTGSPGPAGLLERVDAHTERLRGQGFEDLDSYREDRQVARAVLEAWERKDYEQAFFCLSQSALPAQQGHPRAPLRVVKTGPPRLEPGCFYREVVEKPEHHVVPRLILARMAEQVKKPALAAFWYREALKLVPGNPIARQRLAALGSPGAPPADLGAPGPGATVRILRHLTQEGWTDATLMALQVFTSRGLSRADVYQMRQTDDPAYLELVNSLEYATAALDRGAKFRDVPVEGTPAGPPDYAHPSFWATRKAVLDDGSRRLLTMYEEEHLWRITDLGGAP